jgi:hypothetical protein
MRKVSPWIEICVLFGAIALILGSCMKPVGVSSFLEDDRVQGIIDAGKGGVIIDPGYENPEDLVPVLVLDDGTELASGDEVTVSLGNGVPTSVTITVVNYEDYDGDVKWYYGNDDLGTGEIFEVVAGEGLFIVEGKYQLAVVGTKNNVPYSIEIFIVVEE